MSAIARFQPIVMNMPSSPSVQRLRDIACRSLMFHDLERACPRAFELPVSAFSRAEHVNCISLAVPIECCLSIVLPLHSAVFGVPELQSGCPPLSLEPGVVVFVVWLGKTGGPVHQGVAFRSTRPSVV